MTDDEIIAAVKHRAAASNASPVASVGAVEQAEESIGYPLPPLLRRLYLEVANGGFGPEKGILGVPGGNWFPGNIQDIVESNEAFSRDPDYPQPPGLIGLLDWGCAIWTVVDCRTEEGRVYEWDPNPRGPEDAMSDCGINLNEWFTAWLTGNLEIPS